MSESAEVKLTTENLKSKLENQIITNWVFKSGKYKEKKPKGFNEFKKNLPLIVENIECKGKFIYFTLFNEKGYFYILHYLGNGCWKQSSNKHCKWYIEFHKDDYNICFKNTKILETSNLEFTSKDVILKQNLDKIGADILTDNFKLELWKNMISKYKDKNITSFLTNQNIISGIGDYIKSESLYYAKISPYRRVGSLSELESERLFEGIRIISRISYNKKGMSINNYTDLDNEKGSYQEDLKIYGKSHAKKIKISEGGITFWDPNLQV